VRRVNPLALAKHQRWASSLVRFRAVDIRDSPIEYTIIPELPDNPSVEGDEGV